MLSPADRRTPFARPSLRLTAKGRILSRLKRVARIRWRGADASSIHLADVPSVSVHLDTAKLAYYDETSLDALGRSRSQPLAMELRHNADSALERGPYSVIQKTTLPPSGDPHDYWHPAAYWWPNPNTRNGLPYIHRDGERVAGTVLYGPGNERFDRTSLQRMFDDTSVLALAWRIHGEMRYAEHAAMLVRSWFLDPGTRMNPHLQYAQVRPGHNRGQGAPSGLIEFKDLYFFLDAVRLLRQAGVLGSPDVAAFGFWLESYLEWLETSAQGKAEQRSANNHGTMFDLQLASIAAYLGRSATVTIALQRARGRMPIQFDASGAQPLELARTLPFHYCCFNLQGWTSLARLAATCGDDLWHAKVDGRGIGSALEWCIGSLRVKGLPDRGPEEFDRERFDPLMRDFDRFYHDRPRDHETRFIGRHIYYPHDGIAPFWLLAR